jgi:broad specificity phosphatase PhoE
MRHLVFVRHGESQLNAISRLKRTYCGQIETPLTECGRQQAEAVGQKLSQLNYLKPQVAVSSSLERAEETLALLLRQLSVDVKVLPSAPGLCERSHGVFEGRAEEDVFREYPHYRDDPAYCHFMNHFEQCAPGGETLAIVARRAWSAVEEVARTTTGDLIFVSHFNPIRCILGMALHFTPDETLRLHIPNAEPIVLGFNGAFKLIEAPDLFDRD